MDILQRLANLVRHIRYPSYSENTCQSKFFFLEDSVVAAFASVVLEYSKTDVASRVGGCTRLLGADDVCLTWLTVVPEAAPR